MGHSFMGADIGTSGVRAAIFDADGRQLGLFYKEYPMICTEKGMGELNPETIFSSFLEVVRRCLEMYGNDKNSIATIGLSTQLFSIMAVDRDGFPLTNVFTWADNRSIQHAEMIEAKYDYAGIYNSTGCRVQHPMYPLSKILWLKATRPDLYEKVYKFVSIKEYILHKLFGEYVIDFCDASSTGCFNIFNFDWDEYVLKNVLAMDKSRFGQPVECTYILKDMHGEYAEEMGLDPAIPIVVGSGDGMLANVGCGVFDDTSMSCTIGTSGALRISVNKPLLDIQQRTWCYCFTRETWVAGGAINNGGIVLKWLRDNNRAGYEYEAKSAGLKSVYELFDKYAGETNAGSDGLIFLPLLTGERSPNWNANAKGVMSGLQLIHSNRHFVRAAMEGVIFRMLSVYEVITQLNDNVKVIRANGGYTNSDIWLQIQADIFGKEIEVTGVGEAAAFGAAYTAMAGVKAIADLRQPLACMRAKRSVKPNRDNMDVYKEAYKQFKELYGCIYGRG